MRAEFSGGCRINRLGDFPELQPRSGVVTGANDVFVLTHVDRKLSGLAAIRTESHGSAIIEEAAVRPLLRGRDVDAFAVLDPV